MKFFDYESTYSIARKAGDFQKPDDFYDGLQEAILIIAANEGKAFKRVKPGEDPGSVPIKGNEHVISYNLATTERNWYTCGVPYFKVDNAAIELFRKISIDIPFKYLITPFDAFAIRLEENNPLKINENRRIKSCLISKGVDQAARGCFDIWTDCGERKGSIGNVPVPVMNYLHLLAPEEETIGTQLQKSLTDGKQNDSEVSAVGLEDTIIRLAIAVCFLATSADKMVRPDVLGKDLAAWAEAERKKDTTRMGVIAARAKRRGKIGYIVDGARELIHTREEEHTHGTGDNSRHLKFRHMRSAHFRLFHSGIVRLIRMHPVRPDLPARDN